MSDATQSNAWLENAAGECFAIVGACSLGRAPTNQIVLADQRASRQHAVIRPQAAGQYWLVDLGSRHGTLLNGRRITQPTLILDGDSIGIGSGTLTFRHPILVSPETVANPGLDTAGSDLGLDPCWLLLADIEDATRVLATFPAEDVPTVTGDWLAGCQQVIEESGGEITQVLEDGFLACWPAQADSEQQVAWAVAALKGWQAASELPFRIVLHYGPVYRGGTGTAPGEGSLSGSEVNFVFHMEKLADQLREPRLLSEAAASLLAGQLELTEAGRHPLPGYEGEFGFAKF
ncbi:hypothetical protein LBMAG56_39140 [Verrucomicrobiota bacterium]|nr:hypothetical protein LBMAG56_39140 [Verrucomicrobiota bacterium]